MKLIRNGDIDVAFGKLREWYPQIVEVGSHIIMLVSVTVVHSCFGARLTPIELIKNAIMFAIAMKIDLN